MLGTLVQEETSNLDLNERTRRVWFFLGHGKSLEVVKLTDKYCDKIDTKKCRTWQRPNPMLYTILPFKVVHKALTW
jgi:hypothetical protein